ncbi:hypothetical protein SK128_012787, partial [Halocaridina rubra]
MRLSKIFVLIDNDLYCSAVYVEHNSIYRWPHVLVANSVRKMDAILRVITNSTLL